MAGCALVSPVSRPCTLILKPQILSGTVTQATVAPYDKSAIHHLTLKIFQGGVDTGIAKTLPNANLNNPVVFSNLKDHSTYQIKAYAYGSTDDSLLISSDDVNSWTDIAVVDDDRPTVGTLKVKLVDRAFNGQATSSLSVVPGGYTPIASESLRIPIRGEVTTYAGNGSPGYLDGYCLGANFNTPRGVALDADGNLYVADAFSHKIRKVTPQGWVSTLAGSGTAGTANGTGTMASFRNPYGIVADASGNLFVADRDNHLIRKVTPEGIVSTLFGGTGSGYADGQGTAALFYHPSGIVMDAFGTLYIADYDNHCIRKATPEGEVSTLAGNGTQGSLEGVGTTARLFHPTSLVLDTFNNLYTSDSGNQRIRIIR